jgi:hypothetical protein
MGMLCNTLTKKGCYNVPMYTVLNKTSEQNCCAVLTFKLDKMPFSPGYISQRKRQGEGKKPKPCK